MSVMQTKIKMVLLRQKVEGTRVKLAYALMQTRFEVSKACSETEREICSTVYRGEDEANQRRVVLIFTTHMEPKAKSLQRNTALLFRSEHARTHTHSRTQPHAHFETRTEGREDGRNATESCVSSLCEHRLLYPKG